MVRRRAGGYHTAHPAARSPALQCQLFNRGHDDTVPGLIYLIECAAQPLILPLDAGKIIQHSDQVAASLI